MRLTWNNWKIPVQSLNPLIVSVGVRESESADGAKVYDLSTGASPRFDELTDEIGRVGAQGAGSCSIETYQYDPLEPTQIMASYGNYRGNSAIAMGVAHYKTSPQWCMRGLGGGWFPSHDGKRWCNLEVGNRDSEAAVADRYRKGPIRLCLCNATRNGFR